MAGDIVFDTGLGSGQNTTLSYRLIEENSDAWNMALGANWQMTPEWGVMLEIGAGGTRNDIIGGVTYRF